MIRETRPEGPYENFLNPHAYPSSREQWWFYLVLSPAIFQLLRGIIWFFAPLFSFEPGPFVSMLSIIYSSADCCCIERYSTRWILRPFLAYISAQRVWETIFTLINARKPFFNFFFADFRVFLKPTIIGGGLMAIKIKIDVYAYAPAITVIHSNQPLAYDCVKKR